MITNNDFYLQNRPPPQMTTSKHALAILQLSFFFFPSLDGLS